MQHTIQQALHIFRKDARQFRFEAATLLALLALMTLAGAQPWSEVERGSTEPAEMFSVLAALAAWFLVGRVMHAEALPGDRHFWLTRPYQRGSLIAAKAIFIAAFVNLPLFVAQTIILAADGLLGGSIAGLLWNQVLVTLVAILPAVALASLTRNMVQYGLASILAGALFAITLDGAFAPNPFQWVRYSIAVLGVAALTIAVVAIQYLRRKRRWSLAVAALGGVTTLIVLVAVPWSFALALQTMAGSAPDGFSAQLGEPLPPVNADGQRVPPSLIRIPYRIPELTDGRYRVDAVQETFIAPSGNEWQPRLVFPRTQRIQYTPEGLVHEFWADGGYLRSWGSAQVRLRTTFYVTAFGEDHVTQVPLDGRPTGIAGLGQCGNLPRWAEYEFVCRAGFRLPHGIAAFHPGSEETGGASATYQPERSYSPFPATITILPVVTRRPFEVVADGRYVPFQGAQAAITVRQPVAHFRYDLDVPGVHIIDYGGRRLVNPEP